MSLLGTYTGLVRRDDLVRFVENHRAVARREAEDLKHHPDSADKAIAAALALVAIYEALHGWPPPEDPVSTREDAEARERFARLRRSYTAAS